MCVVGSEFTCGERIVTCAEFIKVTIHIKRASCFTSLEHHVLEEVRDAHKFSGFITRASADKKAHSGRVGEWIDLCLDLKSIRETGSAVGIKMTIQGMIQILIEGLSRVQIHESRSLTKCDATMVYTVRPQ